MSEEKQKPAPRPIPTPTPIPKKPPLYTPPMPTPGRRNRQDIPGWVPPPPPPPEKKND